MKYLLMKLKDYTKFYLVEVLLIAVIVPLLFTPVILSVYILRSSLEALNDMKDTCKENMRFTAKNKSILDTKYSSVKVKVN